MLDRIASNSMSNIRVQSSSEVSLSSNDVGQGDDRVLTSTELLEKRPNELSISDAALQKALVKVNKALKGLDTRLEYKFHDKTGDMIVKIINADTNEIVREVPSEKIVDLIVKLQELSGLIIDEKR
ncbi:flagellar protein FlaG [Paenibacillus guangzhouensis]|uniref:flagellar protein FlaG n=1 Tax=Paenibacillus guangzhouensis TaxID=1473112 RepID=UPI00187B3FD4|nr:flagellar protein FlaG [Paenibacillus guangzhouensis]